MKTSSFRLFFIGLSQVFTAFNLLTYAIQMYGKSGSERSSFLLYQACYQPDGVSSIEDKIKDIDINN